MFASIAVLAVTVPVGVGIPDIPMQEFAMLLCLTLGIMGITHPYATGPSPVYYGSGYLPSGYYWRLGAIFGAIYLAALLAIGTPSLFTIR